MVRRLFKPLESPYGSFPQAINDRGVAVGFILTEGGSPVHGAVWGKALTRIPPRDPRPVTARRSPSSSAHWAAHSYAIRINDRRQMIGYSEFAPDRQETQPFLWENGVMRDLSADPGGLELARDINDQGHIAGGAADREDGSTYGAVWHNGIRAASPAARLRNSSATAINEVGLVAGFCIFYLDPVLQELVGVFWRNGVIEASPPRGCSCILRRQRRRRRLGIAFRGSEVSKFLWQDGVLTDIDQAAAGAFYEVVAINGRGEIARNSPGPSLLQALIGTAR